MTQRVPCTECGAEILPATAAATGGVCMACKKGIRKDLENAKRYYAKQKEYDPYRELWSSLAKRNHKTEAGYEGFSADERLYFSATLVGGRGLQRRDASVLLE